MASETALIDEIVAFWFGKPGDADYLQYRKMWFSSTSELDAEIQTRFGHLIPQAIAGELSSWEATPMGILALILVCDQFTRNTMRGTPGAFSGDVQALRLTLKLIETGGYEALPQSALLFAFMPFQHTEDASMQIRGAEVEWPRLSALPSYAAFMKSVHEHRDTVVRFGRFPHRNAILGRESTPEEVEFLKTANTYGQAKPAAAAPAASS